MDLPQYNPKEMWGEAESPHRSENTDHTCSSSPKDSIPKEKSGTGLHSLLEVKTPGPIQSFKGGRAHFSRRHLAAPCALALVSNILISQ
jgi:hypothetical protein